nr:MAG TPA_asm: hypothetical protein [Caudoviricetes sp.]
MVRYINIIWEMKFINGKEYNTSINVINSTNVIYLVTLIEFI